MPISTRSSALAIKEESTQGTPVVPSAPGDYVAIQDDFDMSPGTDVIENAEIRASIGQAKPILGLENPEASFSHYLRHSGVEGQAPNYRLLLESAFGSETVVATEDDTVGGSTTTVLNVDTGEGADYPRGRALLIKDPTNGYRIRAVHSRSSDALTLSFALPNAPASGVNLGKSVDYAVTNSGHIPLSMWHYLGNSGAIQLLAGAKVSQMDISIAAGELINASYTLAGTQYMFNPIVIDADDTYIDWTDDDGTFAAAVTAKTYSNPHELAAAITSAMNATATTETHTVTYSDTTGKFRFTATGTVLSLLWNSGTNTANTIGDAIGFSVAADDTGTAASTGYTADNAISLASPQTPTVDNSDPLAAKNHEAMLGDADDYLCFGASSVEVSMSNELVDLLSVCAESGKSGNLASSRTVTVTVTALLDQYDADKYRRYKEGINTRFQYSFGTKTGGNWVEGKSGLIYLPDATITEYNIADSDGNAELNMTLQAYVDSSSNGEFYLGFV